MKQLEATGKVSDWAYDFLDGFGDFIKSIDPKQKTLTGTQKTKYLNLVEKFRRHYEKENQENGTSNKYDDPATSDGPEAAYSIINSVHSSGQKITQDEGDLDNVTVTFKRKPKTEKKASTKTIKVDSTKKKGNE